MKIPKLSETEKFLKKIKSITVEHESNIISINFGNTNLDKNVLIKYETSIADNTEHYIYSIEGGYNIPRPTIAYILAYIMFLYTDCVNNEYNQSRLYVNAFTLDINGYLHDSVRYTNCRLEDVFYVDPKGGYNIREGVKKFLKDIYLNHHLSVIKEIKLTQDINSEKNNPEEDKMTAEKYKKDHVKINKTLFVTDSSGVDSIELMQDMITKVISIKAHDSDNLNDTIVNIESIRNALNELTKQIEMAEYVFGINHTKTTVSDSDTKHDALITELTQKVDELDNALRKEKFAQQYVRDQAVTEITKLRTQNTDLANLNSSLHEQIQYLNQTVNWYKQQQYPANANLGHAYGNQQLYPYHNPYRNQQQPFTVTENKCNTYDNLEHSYSDILILHMQCMYGNGVKSVNSDDIFIPVTVPDYPNDTATFSAQMLKENKLLIKDMIKKLVSDTDKLISYQDIMKNVDLWYCDKVKLSTINDAETTKHVTSEVKKGILFLGIAVGYIEAIKANPFNIYKISIEESNVIDNASTTDIAKPYTEMFSGNVRY